MGITEEVDGYTASCPHCGWEKEEYDSEKKAQKGLATHQRLNCPGEDGGETQEEETSDDDPGEGREDGSSSGKKSRSQDSKPSKKDTDGSSSGVGGMYLVAAVIGLGIILYFVFFADDAEDADTAQPDSEPESEASGSESGDADDHELVR